MSGPRQLADHPINGNRTPLGVPKAWVLLSGSLAGPIAKAKQDPEWDATGIGCNISSPDGQNA